MFRISVGLRWVQGEVAAFCVCLGVVGWSRCASDWGWLGVGMGVRLI